MRRKYTLVGVFAGILILLTVAYGLFCLRAPGTIRIVYPFDQTLFPPEMFPPTFRWEDINSSTSWTLSISLPDEKTPLVFHTSVQEWTPDNETWEHIKGKTRGENATVVITGHKNVLGCSVDRSEGSISFQTSVDEVGAPIFYRDVPLTFEYALKHMDEIKWRLGDISTKERPQVVLENMPVCGNCHSFSADGSRIGMDVDYANDKGSYIITGFDEEIMLTKDQVITWSDYKRRDDDTTYGLLSQISPDGRYVVSTVKDRSVFIPVDDLYFSQLFFPLRGILAYYDTMKGEFSSLPGADDTTYVQSNPVWSPDGKYILFARNNAARLRKEGRLYMISQQQYDRYVAREDLFLFDLYRIPFNGGKGGKAEPLKGASNNGKSNFFPKYSPDGKWIVFCQAQSFMLLQPDSKLYIMPAEGGEPREMNCNTDRMNSWHSWSPNGKWLVFSSKMFTPYTQFFLTHIDENGTDTPPVLLSHFTAPDRAANIPEFVNVKPEYTCAMHELFADDFSFYRAGQEKLQSFGDQDLAAKDFKKALEINPENADARQSLATIYWEKKEFKKAEAEFKKVLEIQPDNAYSHFHLGRIFQECNELTSAEKEYRAALECDPTNFFSYHQLGYLYMKQKRFPEAETVFNRMLSIAEEFSEKNVDGVTSASSREHRIRTYADIGVLHFMKKDYQKAEQAFERVISLAPQETAGYMSLAKVFVEEKKYRDAVECLQKALSLSPNDKKIRSLLARLQQHVM